MRTNAHNTLSALALAIALASSAGSALAAGSSSPSGYELAPRADTRASFLVAWQDDRQIVPRYDDEVIYPRHDEERIYPRQIIGGENGTVAP